MKNSMGHASGEHAALASFPDMLQTHLFPLGEIAMARTKPEGLELVLLTLSDAVTSLTANGSTAFKWKLCCHWLKGLWQCHIAVVIQASVARGPLTNMSQCNKIERLVQSITWDFEIYKGKSWALSIYYIVGTLGSYLYIILTIWLVSCQNLHS